MRKAVLAVAALVVAVGGLLLALSAGTDDGARAESSVTLAWVAAPLDVQPEQGLEGDHILVGRLRNTSRRTAELDAERVRVLDADGRQLKTSARFSHTYAHGIYSAEMTYREGPPPSSERRRLGEIATVRPGAQVPVTVSWRGEGAARIDLGGATVEIPAA